jgi:hypothetical protein
MTAPLPLIDDVWHSKHHPGTTYTIRCTEDTDGTRYVWGVLRFPNKESFMTTLRAAELVEQYLPPDASRPALPEPFVQAWGDHSIRWTAVWVDEVDQ